MEDAPERIWAEPDYDLGWTHRGEWFVDGNSMVEDHAVEYIRADLAPSPETVKALREALRPFADHAKDRDVTDDAWDDSSSIAIVVRIGDLRNVTAALALPEVQGEDGQ